MVLRTSDDVNAIHNRTGDRIGTLTRGHVSIIVQMFGDTSATRPIQPDGVYLLSYSAKMNRKPLHGHTSSKKVKAPYLSARSQISLIGPMLPHMEYTLSKAMTLGVSLGYCFNLVSKSSISLCLNMTRLAGE